MCYGLLWRKFHPMDFVVSVSRFQKLRWLCITIFSNVCKSKVAFDFVCKSFVQRDWAFHPSARGGD